MVEELLDDLEFLLRWQFIPSYRRQRVLHELRREVEAPTKSRRVSRLRWWQYLANLPSDRAPTIIGREHGERGTVNYAKALLWILIILPALIIVTAELGGFAGRGVAALALALALTNFGLVMRMRKRRLAAERARPEAS